MSADSAGRLRVICLGLPDAIFACKALLWSEFHHAQERGRAQFVLLQRKPPDQHGRGTSDGSYSEFRVGMIYLW
jgi:hypothetical protein